MPKFYDDLKNMGETNLSNFSEPQAVTFAPTSTHYNRGVIERYFVVGNLTNQTVEIDEVQYNHVKNPTMGINSNLWVPKRLKWKIKGPAYDLKVNGMILKKGIYDVNLSRVEKASLTTPAFRNHFNDLLHSAIIEYPDMNNKKYDTSSMASLMGYGDMSNRGGGTNIAETTRGHQGAVATEELAGILNKDYSGVMKAIEKKKKGGVK